MKYLKYFESANNYYEEIDNGISMNDGINGVIKLLKDKI